MEMVKLSSIEDWETLPVTSWGIKQPKLKDDREDALKTGKYGYSKMSEIIGGNVGGLDFIVVPGVAFTSKGLRLGHGGGYYDKFLANIKKCQEKPPACVALAFKEQVLEDLPTSETDVKIDLVLYAE
jgi:5-formyltetrahydrofolate cyclo-ligase